MHGGCWVLGVGCWVLGAGCWVRGWLFRPAQTRAGCAARRVRWWVSLRVGRRVGGQQALSGRWCPGRGQWEAGCRAGWSGAGAVEETARVCAARQGAVRRWWVVCFPLLRETERRDLRLGLLDVYVGRRTRCQSWSQAKATRLARPKDHEGVQEGYRGSMASTASRAHRGISPHVIPARLPLSIEAPPCTPVYSPCDRAGHSGDRHQPPGALCRRSSNTRRAPSVNKPFVVVHKRSRPSALLSSSTRTNTCGGPQRTAPHPAVRSSPAHTRAQARPALTVKKGGAVLRLVVVSLLKTFSITQLTARYTKG